VEIQHRQRTVDFINQSTTIKTQSLTRDQANLAEELGSMNSRFQNVAGSVSEKLKQLDTLQMNWKDYDEMVDSLMLWFTEQDIKLGNIMQLSGQPAVQQAIRDCQVR